MARAHAANACVQSDSIKGLAQSIAKPAYHRLLIAEPALRRAVPTLIIAFLITICLGAVVQVIDQTRQKRAAMKRDLAAVTDLMAERIDRLASVRQDRALTIDRLQSLLPELIPSWGNATGRHFIITGWIGIFRTLTPWHQYVHLPTRALRGVAPAILITARKRG